MEALGNLLGDVSHIFMEVLGFRRLLQWVPHLLTKNKNSLECGSEAVYSKKIRQENANVNEKGFLFVNSKLVNSYYHCNFPDQLDLKIFGSRTGLDTAKPSHIAPKISRIKVRTVHIAASQQIHA